MVFKIISGFYYRRYEPPSYSKVYMKRRSKKSLPNLDRVSSSGDLSQDLLNADYVQEKRKKQSKKALKKKPSSVNDMFEGEDQEVVDIKRGDKFIREHYRPTFLKRWDGESNYLKLQAEELESMSPMLRIYWEHKSKNMNCIIFVQLGKIEFMAFEDDAIKLHEIFKKPLKKFSKYLMVNFWSKEIQLAKVELFQRRIPILMLNEVEDEEYKEAQGIFKREITQVITPSIYLTMQPKQFRERTMLVVYSGEKKSGVVCVDVETNHLYLEQLEDDHSLHQIRRIVNRYRPAQLLIQKKDHDIKKMGRQICSPYIIQGFPMKSQLIEIIRQMRDLSEDPIFMRFANLLGSANSQETDEKFDFYPIIMALGLLLNYLKNLGLETKIFGQGIFEFVHFRTAKLKPMFDSQVYENLQIFHLKDEEDSFGKEGTLYDYLNKCITNSGQRMLKKWMDEPLRNKTEIKERQAAIAELLEKKQKVFIMHKQLIGFQKLERRVANIYHWALRSSEQGKIMLTKEIKFDKDYDEKKNPAIVRLIEIYDVIKMIYKVEKFLQNLSKIEANSSYLKKCCEIVETDNLYKMPLSQFQELKGVPSIASLVDRLNSFVQFNDQRGIVYPREGMNQVYDEQKTEVDKINYELDEILDRWKQKLDVSKISYVSVRARNEIQVPLASTKNKKFKQLVFSSQTSKMIRYVTAETMQLSQRLMEHQVLLSRAYEPFLAQIVKQFCSHKHVWDLYIKTLSRIDVLLSLAKVSATMVPRCLPDFVENELYVKNGHHAGLLQVKPRDKVIGNTLQMKGDQRVLLLTGPNMGGKSTLLRQTCLLAIMAQIGCYVPAEKYECIIFDQIFCRIGASDRMIEGKSTFYVQLQETKRIVDQATPDSLVIIDELGRGTSTYDGMALASAILKYIITQIQSYTLFSTHYYPLTTWFSHNPEVQCSKIGYYFEEGRIRFTYQLEEGVAEKSFANEVAAMVGICEETLQQADLKASQMQVADKLKALQVTKHHPQLLQMMDFVKN